MKKTRTEKKNQKVSEERGGEQMDWVYLGPVKKPRYRVNWRIPRMTDGTVQLPIQLGALKILELGRIEHERSQFHNERYIFPIGYTAERSLWTDIIDT